jgi:hypothetical protein
MGHLPPDGGVNGTGRDWSTPADSAVRQRLLQSADAGSGVLRAGQVSHPQAFDVGQLSQAGRF